MTLEFHHGALCDSYIDAEEWEGALKKGEGVGDS